MTNLLEGMEELSQPGIMMYGRLNISGERRRKMMSVVAIYCNFIVGVQLPILGFLSTENGQKTVNEELNRGQRYGCIEILNCRQQIDIVLIIGQLRTDR